MCSVCILCVVSVVCVVCIVCVVYVLSVCGEKIVGFTTDSYMTTLTGYHETFFDDIVDSCGDFFEQDLGMGELSLVN